MSRQMRMDRPVPIRQVKVTPEQVMEKLRREVKRRLLADGLISDPSKAPPKYEWHWMLGDQYGIVRANTSGEARGKIKQELGLKKRLPKEIQIVRVDHADQSSGNAAASIGPASS